MSTNDTLSALKAAIAAGGTPNNDLQKFTFSQNSNPVMGLQDYDLAPAVLNLYPVMTPLRNMIPRVGGGFGSQANWKAVTAVDTGNISAGVSEGHRGEFINGQTAEYMAAYRTLGSEANITDEAILAAADFDDVRARAGQMGLQSLMLAEEQVLLGGNTSMSLGVTPTPVLTASTTGGALGVSTVVSVICVALTLDGAKRSNVANGIVGQRTRITADGFTETVGGGSAIKSAAATATTDGSSTASSVTARVAPVRGAVKYGWFVGPAGSERLMAVTSTSMLVITALPGAGQLASALPAVDSSRDILVHDGLLTFAGNPAMGAYWKSMPAGTGLTADGNGGIVEFDDLLQAYWDNLKLSPDKIWISSQEQTWIRKKILTGNSTNNSRFTFNVQQNTIVGGGKAKGYTNPFAMAGGSEEIPLEIHPNMPAGTVLFTTSVLPYQANNVDNVLQVKTRKDYYQTEWPRRTRAYEYGVYSDQVLQCKFMPSLAVISNIAAQ